MLTVMFLFSRWLVGPMLPVTGAAQWFDLDGDRDCDLADFAVWQRDSSCVVDSCVRSLDLVRRVRVGMRWRRGGVSTVTVEWWTCCGGLCWCGGGTLLVWDSREEPFLYVGGCGVAGGWRCAGQ